LNDNTGASDAVLDHRFRLGMDFTISDRLSVHTRFDALDGQQWGQIGNEGNAGVDDINFDRAYLEAKFDMFDLYVGRKIGGVAFTSFVDNERDADRLQFKMNNLGDFTLIGFYEKLIEDDYANQVTDQDADEYALLGMYSQETFEVGTILAYVRNATTNTRKDERYIFNPYAKAIVGPVTLTAEGEMDWGDRERDGQADQDLEGFALNIEAAMDVGPAGVMVGWAHVDGDDPNDNDVATFTTGGTEWEPFLILTYGDQDNNLGGNGNLQNDDTGMGFDLYYGRVDFAPMENVGLYGMLGFAYADEETAYNNVSSQDDDIGWEFDLGADIALMDNLTYSVVLGYFDPGDLWKNAGSNPTRDDATYTVLNQLLVKF
jgi:hypothetical protein